MWFEKTEKGVVLKIWVQPGASKTGVVGLHGDPPALKIRIVAPPVEGAANEELLRFLKKKLGVPLSRLSILRGHSSRRKDVLCLDLDETQVHKALISV